MARELSQTPSAIAARERRFNRELDRQEREFNAEVKKHMDAGLSFDDAWCAAGGEIWCDGDGKSDLWLRECR